MADEVQVKFGAQTGQLDSAIDRIENNFRVMFTGTENEAKEAAASIRNEMQKIVDAVKLASDQSNGLASVFGSLKRQVAGLAAGYGLTQLARGVTSTIMEFERLRAVLTTLEGGASEARFSDLKQFAQQTPYDLQQVVTAFAKLKAQGLDPSNEALMSYGNTASAMSKSLDQMVEAVADAAVGEFERLKEFGIKARQQGDSVTFMFKGQSTTVKRSSEEIQKYLQNIGNVEFGGAMTRQMETLGGGLANLSDVALTAADEIGQGGLTAALKDVVADMVGAAESSMGLANALGEGLGVSVTAVWQIVLGFGDAVTTIFEAVGDVVSSVTGQTESNAVTWGNIWRGALVVINGFGVGVRVAFTAIGLIVKSVIDTFLSFGKIVGQVMTFDFSGAVDTYRQWGRKQEESARKAADGIVNALQEGKARQDAIVAAPPPAAPKVALPTYKAPAGGGSFGSSGGGGSKSRMTEWRDELQQKIQAETGFFRDSTALEIAFWKAKLSLVGTNSKEAQQIRGQLFQLEKQQAREALTVQLDALDDQQTAARDDFATQMSLQDQKMEAIRRSYGEDSQQFRNLLREKTRMQRDHNDELIRIENERINRVAQIEQTRLASSQTIAQTELEMRRQAIEDASNFGQIDPKERMVALGQVLDQELALETTHENNIYQLKYKSLEDQIKLYSALSPERRKLLGELEVLEAEHNSRMGEIRAQQQQKIQKYQSDIAEQTKQMWANVLQPIGNAFSGMLTNMLTGSQSFREAFMGAMDSLFNSFVQNVMNMGVQWLTTQLGMTAASQTQTAVRMAADATAATTGQAVNAAAGTAQIATNAAVGASGAFAATAPIPFVGPALAPGIAAAAMAAIFAFGSLISARGGADIGSGVNPMAQLHEEEMVLPAHIANPLRSMLAGAGPRVSDLSGQAMDAGAEARSNNNSSNNSFSYAPNVSGGDSSLEAMLRSEGATMRRWFNKQVRDGHLKAATK